VGSECSQCRVFHTLPDLLWLILFTSFTWIPSTRCMEKLVATRIVLHMPTICRGSSTTRRQSPRRKAYATHLTTRVGNVVVPTAVLTCRMVSNLPGCACG
jgi:hypothetical protein